MLRRRKRLSSARCCSSAATVGGNDDLLTEILVLLPAKSAVRFKLVSKHWSSLISAESFARLHVQNHDRRRAETQHSFILGDIRGTPQFYISHPASKKLVRVSLPNPIKQQHVKILQSLNGILLLSLKVRGENRIDYVVLNPITKQYRFIHLDGYRPDKICLVYDPSKSEYYKLVMGTATADISIYDSATHQWTHGVDNPFIIGTPGVKISPTLCCNIFASFFRQLGRLLRIQIPEAEVYRNYVFDSNEYLNILQLKPLGAGEEHKRCFRVCERIDNNKCVVRKKATLDFDSSTVELLGMIREGMIEDSAIFLFHVPGRLLIYRFSDDHHLEVLVDYRNDYFYVEDMLQFQHAHPFVHTFASV